MLDNEEAQRTACCRYCEQEGQPVAEIEAEIHGDRKRHERQCRRDDLPDRAPRVGRLVFCAMSCEFFDFVLHEARAGLEGLTMDGRRYGADGLGPATFWRPLCIE